MITCALDDLIFSIKISTAAKALGVDVYFERSPNGLVSRVRERRPSLVIFDLNSAKLRPIEQITALKADPEVRHTRILGFVAHVDANTTAAARRAGIDQVVARSTFSSRLGEILTGHPIASD